MEWWLILLVYLGSMVALLATGLPVAFVFLFINLIGAVLAWGFFPGLSLLTLNMRASVSSFTLVPIPMFVLLGEVIFRSGMGTSVIDALDKWLGRLPGRLALLSVAASTLFSTMSGSSVGTTAMLGDILIPEMQKRGYKKTIAIGSVMGTGGLAMVIPPSGITVLLAAVAQISTGKLLMAGFIPGLVLAALYATYVIGRCWLQPSVAPSYEVNKYTFAEKMYATVQYVLPMGFIIFAALGLIFFGIATPTEAAGAAALCAFIVAAAYKRVNWKMIKESVMGSVTISLMVLMIILTSTTYAQILTYSGATRHLVEWTMALPLAPMGIIIFMMLVLLVMGCFLAIVPMIMITAPIFFPIVKTLGFDQIWFGLLMIINLEMAQTTPPYGTLLFVMKGVAPKGTTMSEIIWSGIPFLVCNLIGMGLFMAFPWLALWLPSKM